MSEKRIKVRTEPKKRRFSLDEIRRQLSFMKLPTFTDSELDMREIFGLLKEGDSAIVQGQEPEEDDRNMSKDQLLAKIREKKEVIEKLRVQPWPMKRKRRTLKVAQKYLQRHESKVSRMHVFKESLKRRWKGVQRFFWNFCLYLIPWESKIKGIESRFGSVVSSYFIFLRWILAINFVMSVAICIFIVLPEVLADNLSDRLNDENKVPLYMHRKFLTEEKKVTAGQLQVVWDYKGRIAKSPLFFGYYSNETWLLDEFKYRLPLTYFLVNIFLIGFSFFVILKKMAANARTNKMSSGKTEQYPFSWKTFTGWDYMIGVAETGGNALMANVMKFRESMTGHRAKQKQKFQWLLFFRRIFANCVITGMILLSTYLIKYVVDHSVAVEQDLNANSFEKNEVPIVVSIITLVYPNIFELISNFLERYHPRTALRLQLGRILALYLLNFYTLIFALMQKMKDYQLKQETLYNQSLLEQMELAGKNSVDILSDPVYSDYDYFDYDNAKTYTNNFDYNFLQNNANLDEFLETAANLLNFTLSNATFFTYNALPLGALLPLVNLLAKRAQSQKSASLERANMPRLARKILKLDPENYQKHLRYDEAYDLDEEEGDATSFEDNASNELTFTQSDVEGFLRNLRRIQRDFAEINLKTTVRPNLTGKANKIRSNVDRWALKNRSRHNLTTTTTTPHPIRRHRGRTSRNRTTPHGSLSRGSKTAHGTTTVKTKDRTEPGVKNYDPLNEINALLQRIVRAYANGFNRNISSDDVTPQPFSLSTVDPVYGSIAIENVLAILKNDVSEAELKNMLLLEIRRKNGLKPNGSEPQPKPSGTSRIAPKSPPVILPVMGQILAKISKAMKNMPTQTIKRYYQNRLKNATAALDKSSLKSAEYNDTLAIIEKQGNTMQAQLPFIPGITDPRPRYKPNIDTNNDRKNKYRPRGRTSKLTKEDYEFLCWENMIGQEVCKLITMDLVMTIASILFVDYFRGLWIRYCTRWWCWNIEAVFPEYGEFKVAENVLHLINNQGMIWLGFFFAPLLPLINNIKIIIILYIRAWAVVTCNVPAAQVFRASRSSNFYLVLALLMLFLCSLPVGYFIATKRPSETCGAFGGKPHFYSVITDELPREIYNNLGHLTSPGIVIPVFVLLVGLREANTDLQKQLIHERTEEKRKVYRMAAVQNLGKGKFTGERGSMALPEKRHVDYRHLPHEERFRREAWHRRSYNDGDATTPRGLLSPDVGAIDPLRPVLPERLEPLPELLFDDDQMPLHPVVKISIPPTEKPLFVSAYTPSLKTLPEEFGQSSFDQEASTSETTPIRSPEEDPLSSWRIVKETPITRQSSMPDSCDSESMTMVDTHPSGFEPSRSSPLQLIELRESPRRVESRTGSEIDKAPESLFTTKKEAVENYKTPFYLYQPDTDIEKYDSGRATMDDSGYPPAQTTSSATETDTGTESETGRLLKPSNKFSKSKVWPVTPLLAPKVEPEEEEDDEDNGRSTPGEQEKIALLNRRRLDTGPSNGSGRLLPRMSLVTTFSPWPSMPDSSTAAPLNKVGPLGSSGGLRSFSIPQQSSVAVNTRKAKYNISVSPVRSGSPSSDGDLPLGRRPYILRQSASRTPSPDYASISPVNMTQSACEPLVPTRLSVIDEGLPASNYRQPPKPRKRTSVHFSPTAHRDFILFDPSDRVASSIQTGRNLDDQELSDLTEGNMANSTVSKETVI